MKYLDDKDLSNFNKIIEFLNSYDGIAKDSVRVIGEEIFFELPIKSDCPTARIEMMDDVVNLDFVFADYENFNIYFSISFGNVIYSSHLPVELTPYVTLMKNLLKGLISD